MLARKARSRLTVARFAAVISLMLSFSVAAFAQTPRVQQFKPNVMSLEIGGAGGLYSLNYERRVREPIVVRAGFTTWDLQSFATGPERLNAVFAGAGGLVPVLPDQLGPGRWLEWGALLETGFHSVRNFPKERVSGNFLTLVPYAGLRYQADRGIWMFHVDVTPLLPIAGGNASWPERSAKLVGAFGFGFVF